MFTNFQRKNMMSREGRKGYRGWQAYGEQYKEFEEKEHYDRDKGFRQQQPFRYQSEYRHSQEHWYDHDQSARNRHHQYRQHPPLQSWGFDTSYKSRQRSYHDNKENKNHPNYTKYSSPNKKISHDRTWASSKRRRSHSPPKFCRNFRSRSPVSSHFRKKRRIKDNRGNSKPPSSKSDTSGKGNILKNEKRTIDKARLDEKGPTVDHRKSKRTPVTGKVHYKKRYINNYFLNRKRFTWTNTNNKKRGNGVTIGKKLTIPPISSDEFNQRSEEVASKGDLDEEINGLEEGEICTDSNDKEKKKTRGKHEREQSVKCNIKQERKIKSDDSEIKPVVESNSSNHDEVKHIHGKEPLRKERHSYDEDTCKFFNRVTSDKILITRDNKGVDCIKTEVDFTRKKDINIMDGMCSVSSELVQEESQALNSCNEKITQENTANTGTDTLDNECLPLARKVKTLKEGKRESFDKLEETLRLTKSSVICGNGMIQKIVSLASKSFIKNASEIENEANAHKPKNKSHSHEKEEVEISDKNGTVMEKGNSIQNAAAVLKVMSKPDAIKPSTDIENSNKVPGRKLMIDKNLYKHNIVNKSSALRNCNSVDLDTAKSTKHLKNVDNGRYEQIDSFEEKVKGSTKEKELPANKKINKDQNDCKFEAFSSSYGNSKFPGITTNCSEFKRDQLNQKGRKASEVVDEVVLERPVTPPPYSSQSSKQNKGYYFSEGPSASTSNRHNLSGAQLGTKKHNKSDDFGNIRNMSTFKIGKEKFSHSSRSLDNQRKSDCTKENDKGAFYHSSSVFKDGCRNGTRERLLEKRVKQTTDVETSKNSSRKRHGSEPSPPAVKRGRKNLPSDGVFYPLGKPPDKKGKIVKPVLIKQPSKSPQKSNEHNQENTEVINAQKVKIFPTNEINGFNGLGRTEISSVKTGLFNKNKRRISHFNSEQRQQKTPVNEAVKYISDKSSDNIFEKIEGMKDVEDAETGLQLNMKTYLVREKEDKGTLDNGIVENNLIFKEKNDLNAKEIENSHITLVKTSNKNIEKQGTDNEKVLLNNVMKEDIVSTVSENQMFSNNHNENCKNLKETFNIRNKGNIDEIHETKIDKITETKIIPNSENIAIQKEKQGQIDSDLEHSNKELQSLRENERTELEMVTDNIVKGSQDANCNETRKAYYDEIEERNKTKETGSNIDVYNQKANENESESEDDMDDIEPIEMIGSLFMNDFSMNDNAAEISLIDKCGIEISESDFKIDFCDDSLLIQNTSSENISGFNEMVNKEKKIENKNYNESGEKCKKNHTNDGVNENKINEIENVCCSKKDFEGNIITERERNPNKEKLKKSPRSRFINTERKKFSAKLETLGKLIDDEKMNENKDSNENLKTEHTTEMTESRFNKEKLHTQTENTTYTKSTEWLKLAKTNMKSLVKVKPPERKHSESAADKENDNHEEDLPSARSLLQWDAPQPTLQSCTGATNCVPPLTSSTTTLYRDEPIANTSVSQTSLKPKVTDKTLLDSLKHEDQLTATCTVKGIHMSISASNCVEDDYAKRSDFTALPSYLDTAQKPKMKSSNLLSLLSNTVTAQNLSPMSSSCTYQEHENSVSTAKAGTWNLHAQNSHAHENNQRSTSEESFQHSMHQLIQKPVQTQEKQENHSNLLQPHQFDQNSSKNATKRKEHNSNLQNNQNGINDIPEQSMTLNRLTKQSYQMNVNHSKNVPALSLKLANVPMFNQLTAPLMDQNNSPKIDPGPSNKRYQTYANTSTMTTPSVTMKSQNKSVGVFSNEKIANQSAVARDVTAQYHSLAYAQVEIPGVREPVRPSTSTSTRQQFTRLEENQPHADVQNFEAQLIAEVTKEEKRRQLYRELCDLDGINTGDFGLDILLLSQKSHVRGLALVNKEAMCLHLGQERRSNNVQQQQEPKGQTLQSRIEQGSIEERIHHLGNLKQNHR